MLERGRGRSRRSWVPDPRNTDVRLAVDQTRYVTSCFRPLYVPSFRVDAASTLLLLVSRLFSTFRNLTASMAMDIGRVVLHTYCSNAGRSVAMHVVLLD